MKFMLRSLLTFLFALCVSSVAFGQINAGRDIKWPTCTSLQYYSPFDNTCHTISSSATVWGAITGTLSSQTDLQTALNGKAAAPLNSLVETGNYTVTGSGQFIQMNCPSACTLTLPASVTAGFTVDVERTGAGALTINPNGITYDGITTGLLQDHSVFITTDGTGYHSTSDVTSYSGCTETPGLGGRTLTCPGTGGTSITVDSATVSSPNLKSTGYTGPGTEVTFDVDGFGNIHGSIPVLASSGAQYSATLVDVSGGDSLGIVATPNQDSGSAVSCDGTSSTTSCHMTVATPSFYHVGQWINMLGGVTGSNNSGVSTVFPTWSPSCMDFATVTVNQITGTTVYFSEPQTIVPDENGCTGTQTGTGGVVQDASYFYPQQIATQPYLTAGGTATPALSNRNWPGDLISNMDAHFALKYGDLAPVTTGVPANLILESNDMCGSGDENSVIAHWKSILNKARADGFNTILSTSPESPGFGGCGLGPAPADFNKVNAWIRQAACAVNQFVKTDCADQVADVWSFGINDAHNAYYVQQTGGWIGHLTNAGGTLFGLVLNEAMIAKSSFTSGGMAGLGMNWFTQNQNMPSVTFGTHSINDTDISGFGHWTSGGFSVNDGIKLCFQQSSTDCYASIVRSASRSNTISLGPSANGSLELLYEYNTGVASDPVSPVDGQCWFNSTDSVRRCRQGGHNVGLGDAVTVPNPLIGPQIITPNATNHVALIVSGSTAVNVVPVQTSDNASTGGVTPMTTNVTVGSDLLTFCTNNSSIAPTDTLGNTFTLIASSTNLSGSSLWIAKNSPGGADSIDCHLGYPPNIVTELTGLDATSPVGASSVGYAASTGVTTSGTSITTTQAGMLWTLLQFNCGGTTSIVPAGMTLLDTMGGKNTASAYKSEVPGTYGVVWDTSAYVGCSANVYTVELKGNITSVQTADLLDFKLSNGTLIGGVNATGHYYEVGAPSGSYEKADGTGYGTPSGSGSGLGDPGNNGFVYRTGLNTTAKGTLAQLIAAYWSDSSCLTATHLKNDGTCDDPSGSFSALTGDVNSTSSGGASTVKGINGVPLCTGFTPTNGQNLQYTTASSPNPCYTAATGGSGGSSVPVFKGFSASGPVLSSGTVSAISTPAATYTAGDLIIAWWRSNAGGQSCTFSSSPSATWHALTAQNSGQSGQMGWSIAAGGSTTVTCTMSSADSAVGIVALDYSGTGTTLDTSSFATGGGQYYISSSYTTSQKTLNVVCVSTANIGQYFQPGTISGVYGNMRANDTGAFYGGSTMACFDSITPAAVSGTVAFPFNTTGGNAWVETVAAFDY
jgi:hypothetical protein